MTQQLLKLKLSANLVLGNMLLKSPFVFAEMARIAISEQSVRLKTTPYSHPLLMLKESSSLAFSLKIPG